MQRTDCSDPIAIEFKVLRVDNEVLSVQPQKCRFCPFWAISKLIFLKHSCETGEPFECGRCGNVFGTNYNLQRHMRSKHGVRSDGREIVHCQQCNYRAWNSVTLERHSRFEHCKATEAGWFNCDYCEYKTWRKWYYQMHILKEHCKATDGKQSWVRCQLCDYKSRVETELQKHLARKHPSKEEQDRFQELVRDKICNLSFRGVSRQDQLNAQPEKQTYKCTQCVESLTPRTEAM